MVAAPAHRPIPLTHRRVLVDQQVGVKEVVDEVWQAIALTWEEDKKQGVISLAWASTAGKGSGMLTGHWAHAGKG